MISFEFVHDCAVLAHQPGLKNVLVTNAYINREPAAELLEVIDAVNIDIKSMDDSFYVEQCHAHLQPVLNFAIQAVECGRHVEITNLIIPGLNDEDRLIILLAEWIACNLGKDIPLHLSAYYPQYKLSVHATPKQQVVHARELALKHLLYVHTGNV
jgi:pyruvate formate lyase activating enzyme